MAKRDDREVTLREWAEILREESGESHPADETVIKWPVLHGDFPAEVRRIGNVRLYTLGDLGAWRRVHPDVGKGRGRQPRRR